MAIILLVLVAKCIATTWIDKCYCPGKDPILNILNDKAKDLRNKMYELKSAHTSKKLNIWWRKCKFMQRMNNSTYILSLEDRYSQFQIIFFKFIST